MVGRKGRSGGARPGAGRKPRSLQHQHFTQRQVLAHGLTPRELLDWLHAQLQRSNAGQPNDFRLALPYVMGALKATYPDFEPDELDPKPVKETLADTYEILANLEAEPKVNPFD